MSTRRAAAESLSEALEPGLRTRAFIYNTLVYDKSVDDRLRSYPHWLASRNLANEASDESVMALIEAVRGRFDIPQRWYRLKAKLLGLDRLTDYDRYAPLEAAEIVYSFGEAREFVLDTYDSLSPDAGNIVRRFFDERWIDAPTRPHKRGGAFCSYTVPSVHPYVMLNYTATRRDVLVMAHELGPRPARCAGPAPGCLSSEHAVDDRRDRVGVRRGADVRPAAGRGRRRCAGSACSPSGSTARSRRCSARWR